MMTASEIVDSVNALIFVDRRVTIEEIFKQLGNSVGTAQICAR